MKKTIYVLAGIIVLVAAFLIGKSFGAVTINQAALGAVGDTQATPKIAQVTANGNGSYVSGSVGAGVYTFASIPNNDADDRIIISIDAFYNGIGSAVSTSTATTFTVKAATSSDTTTLNSNTNVIYGAAVGTSTSVAYEASSTPGVSSTASNAFGRVWKAGSNLNFVSNATTSASIWYRVSYLLAH